MEFVEVCLRRKGKPDWRRGKRAKGASGWRWHLAATRDCLWACKSAGCLAARLLNCSLGRLLAGLPMAPMWRSCHAHTLGQQELALVATLAQPSLEPGRPCFFLLFFAPLLLCLSVCLSGRACGFGRASLGLPEAARNCQTLPKAASLAQTELAGGPKCAV